MKPTPRHLRSIWTAQDVAEELGFSVSTVQGMLRRKELHGVRLRGEWRVRAADVEGLFAKHERAARRERMARTVREARCAARPSLARLANVVASDGGVG